MTNNEILSLMVENATAATNDDKTLDNALRLVDYTKSHPDDFAADYARDFISAYIYKDYVGMMTDIANFAKFLASEREIVEELN